MILSKYVRMRTHLDKNDWSMLETRSDGKHRVLESFFNFVTNFQCEAYVYHFRWHMKEGFKRASTDQTFTLVLCFAIASKIGHVVSDTI